MTNPLKARKRLYTARKRHSNATATELAKLLGCSRQNVHQMLRRMGEQGAATYLERINRRIPTATRNIAALRVKRGLTQADIAAMAGISMQHLSLIELGRPAKLSTVEKIASALGVKAGKLVAK